MCWEISDRFNVNTLNTNVLLETWKVSISYQVVIVNQSFSVWIDSVLSFLFKMKFNSFVPNIFFPVHNLLTHHMTTEVLP